MELPDITPFDPVAEEKTVDNEGGLKPPGQNLSDGSQIVVGFNFDPGKMDDFEVMGE